MCVLGKHLLELRFIIGDGVCSHIRIPEVSSKPEERVLVFLDVLHIPLSRDHKSDIIRTNVKLTVSELDMHFIAGLLPVDLLLYGVGSAEGIVHPINNGVRLEIHKTEDHHNSIACHENTGQTDGKNLQELMALRSTGESLLIHIHAGVLVRLCFLRLLFSFRRGLFCRRLVVIDHDIDNLRLGSLFVCTHSQSPCQIRLIQVDQNQLRRIIESHRYRMLP